MTEERLFILGRFAFPCNCKDLNCKGWQMARPEVVIEEVLSGHDISLNLKEAVFCDEPIY